MVRFNRQKFFDGYRTRFGPLRQDLVDALEFLLAKIEQDTRFATTDTGRRQIAYCLATFKWETAHTMQPIDEFGSSDYFNTRYGLQTRVGKVLGNTQTGDGARFHGRGYVQLTGRFNYTKAGQLTGVDLLKNPDRAKENNLAYTIAVEGMQSGWFTGKRLNQFFREGAAPEFEQARKIINGMDKAVPIADIARRFDEILLFSKA